MCFLIWNVEIEARHSLYNFASSSRELNTICSHISTQKYPKHLRILDIGIYWFSNYFFGISFSISFRKLQNFWAEGMLALSSGECAPRMVGPKLTISIFG